ncbi:F-box only protein 28 isoform X2 [Leptidea sinapis]|uniref:F-box only protein 28 isoform X2 n=1 Tax=Leptidea sinapis TaxID=189913 RepID=UPI002135BE9D|nr:F-box only protein 28 isoform X2 [Leptidea sinapis]
MCNTRVNQRKYYIINFAICWKLQEGMQVSRAFNEVCMRMLNRGFLIIERSHAMALKNVKAKLPRRESERRYHPLARHCDILTSIETRISMLNMTYSKFVDSGICCFIPGKVIDEIKRVLHIVETSKTPPRAHEVLQELRDISSMAIEHFDDKISPAFRKNLRECANQPPPRTTQAAVPQSCTPFVQTGVLGPLQLRQEILLLRKRSKLNSKVSLFLASQYNKFYKWMIKYKRIAWRQRRTIRALNNRQRDQEAVVADLKKRIEECDIKYTEITHTNQAVGGKVIAASTVSESGPSQSLRHFGSQIKLDLSVLPIGTNKSNASKLLPNMKPRKPLIKLPSMSEGHGTAESNPLPSTSKQSPRAKTQSAMAKIRGIAEEILQLSNLSKDLNEQLKRPLESDEEVEAKKRKLN